MTITAAQLIAEPTRANVLEYLIQRQLDAFERGQSPWPPEQEFADQAQLEAMEQAREWWPVDAPPTMSFGFALMTACDAYAHPDPNMQNELLTDGLSLVAHRAAEWLISEGRDPTHPNETAEQRRKRVTRERVKRHRLLKATDGDPAAVARAQRTAELYQAFRATCDRRARVRAELDAEVAAAWAAFQESKRAAPVVDATPEVPAVPEG